MTLMQYDDIHDIQNGREYLVSYHDMDVRLRAGGINLGTLWFGHRRHTILSPYYRCTIVNVCASLGHCLLYSFPSR